MVEASDHGYVLHTRRIHVTRYRIRIQHQWRLAILNQFSVLIYAVTMYNNAKRTLRKLQRFISSVILL
jgi:hypothetical protein